LLGKIKGRGSTHQELNQIQGLLEETRKKLVISQQEQVEPQALLDKTQQRLLASQREQNRIQTLWLEAEGQLRAYRASQEGRLAGPAEMPHFEQEWKGASPGLQCVENAIRDLRRQLDAAEQRNTKYYVSRKMVEQELECSNDILESVKARLRTSEAALKSYHCQNTQSSAPPNTVENDLAYTKVVVATVKQRNEDFVKDSRILVRQVNDLEQQVKNSREILTQRTRSMTK
jgi:chromosome segregation ATPase